MEGRTKTGDIDNILGGRFGAAFGWMLARPASLAETNTTEFARKQFSTVV
jgi:hypothetical protein